MPFPSSATGVFTADGAEQLESVKCERAVSDVVKAGQRISAVKSLGTHKTGPVEPALPGSSPRALNKALCVVVARCPSH